MHRPVAVVLVSVILGACAGASGSASPAAADVAVTNSASALRGTVGPSEARIVIPVEPQAGPWRWNAPDTPENRREYGWQVELADSTGTAWRYQFGFSHFKAPGATSGSGSLADLLAAGQATIWERTPTGGGQAVAWGRVHVRALGDSAVVLSIIDPATLERLFASRPTTATVLTATPGRPEERMPLALTYLGR